MRSYAAAPGALVGVGAAVPRAAPRGPWCPRTAAAAKTKDKVKVHSANRRNLKLLAYCSLAVSHRLERPGPRVSWSVAAVQEELGLGYAYSYTDSRSHIKPEAKAAVEEAKLRYGALPPAGLVHEVAEIVEKESFFLTEFNFFTIASRGLVLPRAAAGKPSPRPRPRPRPRADTAQTVPTSDAPLRTAAAVLQQFVSEGHGRRIVDGNDRDVKPDEV
ncbi:hypothetical protein HC256_009292 [Beauveria bassiana]|nr:hypothetical protein HC256_009292 [Beauveria bassiana]